MKPTVVFVATYDTKGVESEYTKGKIQSEGVGCLTIDVGVAVQSPLKADITLADLCSGSSHTAEGIRAMKRGEAIAVVSTLLETYAGNLFRDGGMDAIIGIGGAGGTQIVTQAMRTLPFGLPKLMLSTLASGNTRWYIQDTDIAMFPSIVDVAGLNCISELVFSRFAACAAQSARWYNAHKAEYRARIADPKARRVSQTMYGTTTKGVTRARERLEAKGFETLVFHASGAGGRSMENFIRHGVIHGVLDMTLAEIGAHLVGGLHDAGPNRLEAAIEMGIPQVIVPGAADTIVLPPMSALPDKFKTGRTLNLHNPTMTTMRTNVEECIAIGGFMAQKLMKARTPVKILIPAGGLSSIDKPGEIFYLPEANEALFETLKQGLKDNPNVEIIVDPRHLYDEGFGETAAELLIGMMPGK
ncbi:MAG: Tm-1-like ATP-binding domain-containing protein [Methylobacteriaceae bacterium]|jgi:uncharacterized protein (UPF0261 family)|nr:Tm-1-like ATP-binding domain-containing protein [Methylobacteriaceae bacterium]